MKQFDPSVVTTVAPGWTPHHNSGEDGGPVVSLVHAIEARRAPTLGQLVLWMEHPLDQECPHAQEFRRLVKEGGVVLVFEGDQWDRELTAGMLVRDVVLTPGFSAVFYHGEATIQGLSTAT